MATFQIIASATEPQVVTVKTSTEIYEERFLPSGGTTGQVLGKASNNAYDTEWQDAGQASNGLPVGGTAGQILSKVDGADYNAEWVDNAGGGAVDSVNSQTGAVVLDADDISDATTANKFTTQAEKDKLAGIADSANNYTHPNHTGDVTSVGDGATVISNDAVSNAKLSNMGANTIKGRASTVGDPQDLTASQVRTMINVEDGAQVNEIGSADIANFETTSELNTRDTNNRNRSNHTGTQSASTISDFASTLAGTTNTTPFTPSSDHQVATKKYVDDSVTAGGGYTDEQAQDAVGGILSDGLEYDDAGNSIGINASALRTHINVEDGAQANEIGSADIANFETSTQLNARDTANRDRTNHTGSQAISTVTGLQTELDNKLENITGLVTAGTNVTLTGSGTSVSPYVIASSGGGGTTDPNLYANVNSLLMRQAVDDYNAGRTALDVAGGAFDIFGDATKVSATTGVTVSSLINGDSYGTAKITPSGSGSAYVDLYTEANVAVASNSEGINNIVYGMCLVNNGSKVLIAGNVGIEEYNFAIAGDFTSPITRGNTLSGNLFGINMTNDGNYLMYINTANGFTLSPLLTPYDISSRGTETFIDLDNILTSYDIGGAPNARSIWMNNAGTKLIFGMHIENGSNLGVGRIYEANFGTAYDAATLTAVNELEVYYEPSWGDNFASQGIELASDGLRLYFSTQKEIQVWDLETPYSLTNAKKNTYETWNRPNGQSINARYGGVHYNDNYAVEVQSTSSIISAIKSFTKPTAYPTTTQTLQTTTINLTNDLASNPTEVFASFDGFVPIDGEITLTLNDGTTDFTINANEFDSFQPKAFGSRTITATWNFTTTNANRTPILDNYVIYFR